jgi:phage FluMu protein Com
MSFQTVKCPQCGKAYIEYPDANLKVTCDDCKRVFEPFAHLKAATATTANNPKPSIPQPQVNAQSQSEKIFRQIVAIDKSARRFKNEDLAWTNAGEAVLQEIKTQMSALGKLVFESMDINIAQLQKDLKPTYTFEPLSNHPQSLGLILAYLYVKMTEFGQEACIMLFAESEHWLFSQDAIERYKSELTKLHVNF